MHPIVALGEAVGCTGAYQVPSVVLPNTEGDDSSQSRTAAMTTNASDRPRRFGACSGSRTREKTAHVAERVCDDGQGQLRTSWYANMYGMLYCRGPVLYYCPVGTEVHRQTPNRKGAHEQKQKRNVTVGGPAAGGGGRTDSFGGPRIVPARSLDGRDSRPPVPAAAACVCTDRSCCCCCCCRRCC